MKSAPQDSDELQEATDLGDKDNVQLRSPTNSATLDTQRLDWLSERYFESEWNRIFRTAVINKIKIREAIDAAMGTSPKSSSIVPPIHTTAEDWVEEAARKFRIYFCNKSDIFLSEESVMELASIIRSASAGEKGPRSHPKLVHCPKCGPVWEEVSQSLGDRSGEGLRQAEDSATWSDVRDKLPPGYTRVLLWMHVHEDSPTFFVGQRYGAPDQPNLFWIIDSFSYSPDDKTMKQFRAKWRILSEP